MGRDLEIKKKNVILLYIIKFDEKKIWFFLFMFELYKL
jgi:hypothetical protein